MNKSRTLTTALLFTLSATSVTTLSAAPNDAATAATSGNSQNSQSIETRSVEDLVAIAKAGENNEAINDAVLGNEAINGAILGNDAINPNTATADETTAQSTPSNRPAVQSSAASVDADKLILNNPVIDQANILDPQEKLRLETQLRNIYQQGLAQAAVVIVPTTNGVPIFDYALQVAEEWQLGNKDIDDGLLLVVAVNDRDMYILTGYGLEGVLPDAAVNRIIREDITPLFKQNDYASGILAGIGALQNRLTADPEILARADAQASERSQSQNSNDIGDSPSPVFLFILAMIFGSFITSIFGRIFGSILTAGGFFAGSLALGGGFFMTLIMAIFLWLFLIARGSGGGRGGKGGRGGRGGGMIFLPGMGGGGGFGGGGFGGGGFGGGGGGFGGGGAGGSW